MKPFHVHENKRLEVGKKKKEEVKCIKKMRLCEEKREGLHEQA
jgi:hypothetical protein